MSVQPSACLERADIIQSILAASPRKPEEFPHTSPAGPGR